MKKYQLTLKKSAKNTQWKIIGSLISGAGETEYPHAKKINLDAYFTPYIKINSKQMQYLIIEFETMLLLKQNHKKQTPWH